jgi:hypothetical protein
MRDLIRKILREDLEYYHVSDASPEEDEYTMGEEDPKTKKRLKRALDDITGRKESSKKKTKRLQKKK